MAFTSVTFLFVFLPILLILYYLVPPRFRNGVALSGSLLFYAWGAPQFVFVLIVSSGVDYFCSRKIVSNPARGKLILFTAIAQNLLLLVYCKYMNFFVEEFNRALFAFSGSGINWTDIVMPIGISFFTFQKISYLVDVYRREAKPARGFGEYLLYVCLFPQLIAGPIVRYHDVSKQLVSRTYSDEGFLTGVWRFTVGLAKKLLIADTLAVAADAAFGATAETAPVHLSQSAAWLGILCYSLQLYFDFSGYSDMAIGLGRMLGFDFLENFNEPYLSRSITDFWRRWHISLSNWMREYLYVPLGGNRVPRWRLYTNLWIVFLLSGFWHGASWNFLIWGAIHGGLLTADRMLFSQERKPWPEWISIPRTFLLVMLAWVFFRAWDLPQALGYLNAMLGTSTITDIPQIEVVHLMSRQLSLALLVAVMLCLCPKFSRLHHYLGNWAIGPKSRQAAWQVSIRAVGCTVMLLLCYMTMMSSQFHPFIYFRF